MFLGFLFGTGGTVGGNVSGSGDGIVGEEAFTVGGGGGEHDGSGDGAFGLIRRGLAHSGNFVVFVVFLLHLCFILF